MRQPFPTLTVFLVDSGANYSAVNDRKLLFHFHSQTTKINLYDGSIGTSHGYGSILISFKGILHICKFVHLVKSSKSCILSTGALKTYDGFRKTPHDVGDSLTLFDSIGNIIKYNTNDITKKNGLDYISCQLYLPTERYTK